MVNRRNVRIHKRRAAGSFIRQFFVGLLLTLVLALVFSVVWFGSRLESLTIIGVTVEGGETVDRAMVKSLVERELEGTYYHIVPKRFSWTYPEARIKQAVGNVDRVSSVTVDRNSNRSITVRFSEYVPTSLWCAENSNASCLFLDSTGYAFTKAPNLSGTAMLRYYNGTEPRVAERPFSYEFIRDTGWFTGSVKNELGWSVATIEQIGNEEATFTLTGGGLLKITMRQNVNDTFDNLRVLLSSEEFQHLEPGNFQYIDLRFGDKVFVNEEAGQPDGELNATSSDVITE